MKALVCGLAFVFAGFVVACSTTTQPGDACGTCGAGQFCCVSTCQPFGSVCGAGADGGSVTDASPTDATQSMDAGSPSDGVSPTDAPMAACARDAGAASVCGDTTHTVACPSGAVLATCYGSDVCTEWVDATSHLVNAACVASQQTQVCDPAHDHSQCDGALIRYCNTNINAPPPGWWSVTDCHARWAPDATCVTLADGSFACSSPSDVPCDPSTTATTCTSQCIPAMTNAMGGVVRPFTCAATAPMCIQNATSVHPVCIPADAVPSTHAPTTAQVGFQCEGTGSLRVEQYGYEWTLACAPVVRVSGGGTFTTEPTHCFAPPDGSAPFCIANDAVLCTSATTASTCVDEMNVTYCVHWQQTTQACTGSVCDPSTGRCADAPPCHVGWPFTPTCAGPDHEWTIGTCATGLATIAACPGCHADASGAAVCGG